MGRQPKDKIEKAIDRHTRCQAKKKLASGHILEGEGVEVESLDRMSRPTNISVNLKIAKTGNANSSSLLMLPSCNCVQRHNDQK